METLKCRIKEYKGPVKRYCQTMRLKDNPELIAAYREMHSREKAWPEIRKGIREVGILGMDIYILDSLLFMIVETPVDFDWNQAMHRLAQLPRQAEWEAVMSKYQQCDPHSTSDEKWKMMECMFYLYD